VLTVRYGHHKRVKRVASGTVRLTLPSRVRAVTVIARDAAGNTSRRRTVRLPARHRSVG
jgi:hypothetical protein